MKKVYICAPLGGNIENNIEKAKRYAGYALKCGAAPVVPHFYALILNDNNPNERELGRKAGMSLLWLCDEIWVFGDVISIGMEAEIKFCKSLNIHIRHIKEEEVTKKLQTNQMEDKGI